MYRLYMRTWYIDLLWHEKFLTDVRVLCNCISDTACVWLSTAFPVVCFQVSNTLMETLTILSYIVNPFLLAMEKNPMTHVFSKSKSGLLQSQALFRYLALLWHSDSSQKSSPQSELTEELLMEKADTFKERVSVINPMPPKIHLWNNLG